MFSSDMKQQIYDALVSAVGESRAEEVFSALGFTITNAVEEIKTDANELGTVAGPVAATVGEVTTGLNELETTATNAGAATAAGLDSATAAVNSLDTTLQATGTDANTLKETIVEIPSDIKFNLELVNIETVTTQMATLKDTFTSVASTASSAFTSINWYSIGNQAATAFKRGLKSVKMPKFSVSWTTTSKSASILGKTFSISIPYPSISLYAKGGFPTAGELFMANEAGPELVGRIGNRTAVANQDQIGDAIFQYMDAHSEQNDGNNAQAIGNAVAEALIARGVGAVYLDGRKLADSINRETQRSGRPAINF